MESAQSKWKELSIAALALGLLVFLVWLFLRPAQPARDLVFGELGRRSATNNATARGRKGATLPPETGGSANGEMATNTPLQTERPVAQNDQSPGRMGETGPTSTNSSLTENSRASSAPVNAAPTIPNPPASTAASPPTRSSQTPTRRRTSVFEDNSLTPEPILKPSTASLLAEAKEAGRGPESPGPARTEDLLGSNGSHQRVFDAEAGSNVVFILDNSMSMMTNGKSMAARQAMAQALELMNTNQTFYVLLFHSGGYEGMPSLGPVAATAENVRTTTNWLFNVGHRTGADPTRAVQRALGLVPAPDTVWLLSDSEMPDRIVDNIREANSLANAHINTIGFYAREGEMGLRRVASENRGAYRFIPAPNAPAP